MANNVTTLELQPDKMLVKEVEKENKVFETLSKVNVNEHTEQKNGLTYLSWPWAWSELMKVYPGAKYEIERFDGKPYLYDEALGYMVFTKLTIDDETREMWLPVMDAKNRAMKATPYEVYDRYGNATTIPAATMFDVNKTIMRCLVKNIAMACGLGLYLYAGEDLPEPANEEIKKGTYRSFLDKYFSSHKEQLPAFLKKYGLEYLDDLDKKVTKDKIDQIITGIKDALEREKSNAK